VNFTDSIEYPQGKTRLPSDFCLQCLACHPFQTREGSYHIRPFRENLAMHKAISLGKLPKVDPWESFLKTFKPPSPKPTPEQTQQQQGSYTATFTAPEHLDRYYEKAVQGRSGIEAMQMLNALIYGRDQVYADQRRIDSATSTQQGIAAQRFGTYANAAPTGGYNSHFPLPTQPRSQSPQPTGPPTKKKRKAGETNESSGRADKGAKLGDAHKTITQGVGAQRTSAAQTPQPTTNPASNTDQRQRDSSNSLENVQRTSQIQSLNITNVPTTSAPTKTLAKGDAAAAKKAADDKASANKAAPNGQNPT
jgi:hypothetical protein